VVDQQHRGAGVHHGAQSLTEQPALPGVQSGGRLVEADQLRRGGVRLREPYQVRDLTTAISCQIGGAVGVWLADPQGLADPAGEGGWSLTSRAILAIFRQFTEPA
jgi:hypothetical protein